MPARFGFLNEILSAESGRRVVVLDGFSPAETRLLYDALTPPPARGAWILPEQATDGDLPYLLKEAKGEWVIVDALHHTELSQLQLQLKRLLPRLPEKRFIVLGNGNLGQLSLPSYYGEMAYHRCGPGGTASAADDRNLLQHARRLHPKYGLGDLVLGPRSTLKLQEAISFVRTKEFCENEWGFRKRHSRGHGVTLLFHGESGTGKTMAAEVMAKELGRTLYQVDLSSIVSKWVGETEKNLKSIFAAAEGLPCILLFDEGDAIFGTRTEVKGTQDRYGNLEVNYLLQEIETFNGVIVLSTNHVKNMDAAFLRRFTFCMTFGRPSFDQRKKIWGTNLPPELPLATDVDFDQLGQFGMTGGNIKNCIRDAAARAAGRGKNGVSQEDFLWAIKRELQKYDRELSREQVGEEYWRKVAPEWESTQVRQSLRS